MKNSTRNIALLAFSSAVVFGAASAYAEQRNGGDRHDGRFGHSGMQRIVAMLDANSDSSINTDEVVAFVDDRFAKADADQNGELTATEISQSVEIRRAGARIAARLIEHSDIDANGTVSRAELGDRQTKLFALMDMDNSGAIEADEMPRIGGKDREKFAMRTFGNSDDTPGADRR